MQTRSRYRASFNTLRDIADLETRRIVGVEALIRWQSPELGLVPPMQFIPLMEETRLILEVGAWALRQAVLDHAEWLNRGLPSPAIAVNVSAIQLRQRNFVDAVTSAVKGAVPPAVDLELTESLLMKDIADNIEKLKAVRASGIGVAVDDFGTGHSSLAHLARLPVDALKIDRSFIITMLEDPGTMTLVQTIISLAHSLKLTVVAEGVDSEEQANILRLLRCDQMQGYLVSKPLPFEEMAALLGAGQTPHELRSGESPRGLRPHPQGAARGRTGAPVAAIALTVWGWGRRTFSESAQAPYSAPTGCPCAR